MNNSLGTLNVKLNAINYFARHVAKDSYAKQMDFKPFKFREEPVHRPQAPTHYYNNFEEFLALFKGSNEAVAFSAVIAYYYGLRIFEVAKLKHEQFIVDEHNGKKTLSLKVIGKGLKERNTSLIVDAPMNYILEYLKRHENDEFLVKDSYWQKKMPKTFVRAKDKVSKINEIAIKMGRTLSRSIKNKFDFTAHSLRRSFAGFSLESGVDITAIQDTLGHSHLSTTKMYIAPSILDKPRAKAYSAARERNAEKRKKNGESADSELDKLMKSRGLAVPEEIGHPSRGKALPQHYPASEMYDEAVDSDKEIGEEEVLGGKNRKKVRFAKNHTSDEGYEELQGLWD